MDRSLAKGYANQFLGQLRPHGEVLAWHQSPRKARALESFNESSLSKKPGRVLDRLRPLLAPVFSGARVVTPRRSGSQPSARRACQKAEPTTGFNHS